MSIARLANAMRAQALLAGNSHADTRVGLVTGYDPNRYAVKVSLMPEGVETGWLPLLSPWVGDGWGLFAGPSVGDLVEVGFEQGSFEAGYAAMRFYNDQDRPLPCPSGEFWLAHRSGSLLKFRNDGTIELHAATAMTSSAPLWTHTGDVLVHGNITGDGGLCMSGGGSGAAGASVEVSGAIVATGNVTAGGIDLETHVHTNVYPGGGTSGGPTG